MDWKLSANLVQWWEVVLVVGHIKLSESGVLKVLELAVRCINLGVLLLDEVLNISESNSLLIDSNILEQVSKITPSSLIDIGKYSILILGIVLEFGIGLNLIIDLVSEDVLVS